MDVLGEGLPRRAAFSLLLLGLLAASPLASAEEAALRAPVPAEEAAEEAAPQVAPEWLPLREALRRDGLHGPQVDRLLASLGPRTQSPMGRKAVELYRKAFFPRPPSKKPGEAYYKGVVTEANAGLCRAYVQEHEAAFARAGEVHGVPPSVAAALLFVETRLGRALADVPENALQTLASMSQSRELSSIPDWKGRMPGWEAHEDWFAQTLPKRADWAYRETRALVRHMVDNGIEPSQLPGSIYGAVGLCQFMPSNIALYGEDGNGDGRIDLYQPEDAVMSLARYLAENGWRAGSSREARHRALMRYNKSVRYANTILALADLVEGRTPPGLQKPEGGAKASQAQKSAAAPKAGQTKKSDQAKKAGQTKKASQATKAGQTQKPGAAKKPARAQKSGGEIGAGAPSAQ